MARSAEYLRRCLLRSATSKARAKGTTTEDFTAAMLLSLRDKMGSKYTSSVGHRAKAVVAAVWNQQNCVLCVAERRVSDPPKHCPLCKGSGTTRYLSATDPVADR